MVGAQTRLAQDERMGSIDHSIDHLRTTMKRDAGTSSLPYVTHITTRNNSWVRSGAPSSHLDRKIFLVDVRLEHDDGRKRLRETRPPHVHLVR